MSNRYSKKNTQKGDAGRSEYARYDKQRARLGMGAKVIAILISLAMVVTAFISAGVYFLD
ncbi:MAG: hypothetical protein IKE52_00695 [Mogibacterium sp.]|nr:hypothetical protein [Mogibacterium sp.]